MTRITPLSFVLTLIGYTLYHSISEYMSGMSIGKAVTGLSVIPKDKEKISFLMTLFRNLGYWFDSLFFGLVAIINMSNNPANQRLGDKWGGTMVVSKRNVPSQQTCKTSRKFFGILLGVSIWLAVLVAKLVTLSN